MQKKILILAVGLAQVVACSGDPDDDGPIIEIANASLPDVRINESYDVKIEAKGGTPPYTFQISDGAAPEGIELKAATGQLTGVAGKAGRFNLTISVSDTESNTGSKAFEIYVIPEPLEVVTTVLADGKEGTPYDEPLAAQGGVTPYSWTVETGALPTGLSIESEGRILGTPTDFGGFDFTVQVEDTEGTARQQQLHLFLASLNPMITTSTVPKGRVGQIYNTALEAEGGAPPYVWEHAAGVIPTGLTLAPDGSLTGTPGEFGNFTFTAKVTDSGGLTDQADVMIRVIAPLAIESATIRQAIIGRPYTFQLQASGGEPPYQWVLANGTLPTGLTFMDDGSISGTTSAVGDYPLTIRVLDTDGARVSAAYTMTVSDRFIYVVEPFAMFPPVCTGTTVSYQNVPITIPESMQIEDLDVSVEVDYNTTNGFPADNEDLKLVLWAPDGRRANLCGNGAGIPGGKDCLDTGGVNRDYNDDAGQANQPERPLSAFDGMNPQGTWTFSAGVVGPTCNREGVINKVTISIRDDRSASSYIVVNGFTRHNLLLEPWVRLTGSQGLPQEEIFLSATLWDVGANGVREGGAGDDVPNQVPLTWSWLTPISGANLTADGHFTAGPVTGAGIAEASGGGFTIQLPLYVAPPDWNPMVRLY